MAGEPFEPSEEIARHAGRNAVIAGLQVRRVRNARFARPGLCAMAPSTVSLVSIVEALDKVKIEGDRYPPALQARVGR